jgi:uncharacterized protein (TIGR03382 family)
MNPPFGRLLSWAFVVLGLVGLVWSLAIVARALQSASWVPTTGVITRSEVRTHRAGPGPNGSSESYSPAIAYQYSVGGMPRASDRIKFGMGSSSSRSYAESWVRRYPSGAAVTVYHDPDDPARAVLVPGLSAVALIPVGITATFSVVGLVLVLRRRRLPDAPPAPVGPHEAIPPPPA